MSLVQDDLFGKIHNNTQMDGICLSPDHQSLVAIQNPSIDSIQNKCLVNANKIEVDELNSKEMQSENNIINSNQAISKSLNTMNRKSIFLQTKDLPNRFNTLPSKKQLYKKSITLSQANSGPFLNFQSIFLIKKKITYFYNNFTQQGRRKQLQQNANIRSIINDQGDFPNENLSVLMIFIIKVLSLCQRKLKKSGINSEDLFMIVPNGHINLAFLILFSSMSILFFFLLSIILIFEGYMYYLRNIITLIIISWGTEVIIQMNTKIYDNTNLISDRTIIIYNYIKKRAFFDLIPLIAIISLPEDFSTRKALITITFIKLRNVLIDINLMQRLLCMSVKRYYIIQLFNLIFKILVLGHIIACLWYLIGQFELHILNYETTWYHLSLGADMIWWKLYLESMYWSLTLMTTGSNVGTSIPQLFFTSFIMLFTTIIFGYMLNTTGIILSQLDQQDENKRIDLNIINEYMRTNKISKSLQGRVNLDLEYFYQHNIKKEQEENKMALNKISPNLQNLLKLEYCKQAIQKMNFITQRFSKESIEELCLQLQEVYYSPNQVVSSENQNEGFSLIYVVKGSLEVTKTINDNPKYRKFTQKYNGGDIAGQINFITGQAIEGCIRSQSYSKVLKLDREKFIQIIQKCQTDYEKFCYLKDQISIQQEYQLVQQRCYLCKQQSHQSTQCNLLTLDKSLYYYNAQTLEKAVQIRQKYNRKNQNSNSYLIRLEIEKQIRKYLWEEKKNQKIEQIIKLKQNKQDLNSDYEEEEDSNFQSDQSINVSSASMFQSSLNSELDENVENKAQNIIKNDEYFQSDFSVRKELKNNQKKEYQQIDFVSQEAIELSKQNKQDNFLIRFADQIQNNPNKVVRNPSILDMRRVQSQYTDQNHQSSINERHIRFDKDKIINSREQKKKNTTVGVGATEVKKVTYIETNQNQMEEEHHKKRQQLFISDFDAAKDWIYYYPYSNRNNIISKCNRYNKRRQKYGFVTSNKK